MPAKSPIIQMPELPLKHVEQTIGPLLHPKHGKVKTRYAPEVMKTIISIPKGKTSASGEGFL